MAPGSNTTRGFEPTVEERRFLHAVAVLFAPRIPPTENRRDMGLGRIAA